MNNNRKQILAIAGLFISILSTSSAIASECVPLKLIDSRNAGVSVVENSCSEKAKLAVGANLIIEQGSRLWLQFDAGDNFELTDAQVICQNRTHSTVKININSSDTPWIRPEDENLQCKDWNNNRISCDSKTGGKNSFFCAVAEAKQANSPSSIALGTSVTMRSIGTAQKIISNVKEEIGLCKNLYGIDRDVAIGWTVLSSGAVDNLKIDSNDDDFIVCVEKVITGVNYGKPERAAREGTKYLEPRPYEPAEAPKDVVIESTLF